MNDFAFNSKTVMSRREASIRGEYSKDGIMNPLANDNNSRNDVRNLRDTARSMEKRPGFEHLANSVHQRASEMEQSVNGSTKRNIKQTKDK